MKVHGILEEEEIETRRQSSEAGHRFIPKSKQ